MENDSNFKIVLKKILHVIGKVFKAIYAFFYSIRFLFYIPFLTIASAIIGFMAVAIVKTLLGLVLPVEWNNGFVETIIFAVFYCLLAVYIFKRRLDDDLAYEWKKPLILNYLPVFICMLFSVFIVLDDFSLESFNNLINLDFYVPTAMDEIYGLLLPLFAPHLWLGCLTHEFLFSTAACIFINSAVSFGICYYIGTRREKGF